MLEGSQISHQNMHIQEGLAKPYVTPWIGLGCRVVETMKYLVAAGANIWAKDNSGNTAIDILPMPPQPSQRNSELPRTHHASPPRPLFECFA